MAAAVRLAKPGTLKFQLGMGRTANRCFAKCGRAANEVVCAARGELIPLCNACRLQAHGFTVSEKTTKRGGQGGFVF